MKIHIISKSSKERSQYMLPHIQECIQEKKPFFVLDAFGNILENILEIIPKQDIENFIYIDFGNLEYPTGINLLSQENNLDTDKKISGLIDFFITIFSKETFGPRIQDHFRHAAGILMCQKGTKKFSILQIVRFFTDVKFRKILTTQTNNIYCRQRVEKTYDSMSIESKSEMITYFQSKFSFFLSNICLRNIFAQVEEKNNIDWKEIFLQKKNIIINLNENVIGKEAATLLGKVFTYILSEHDQIIPEYTMFFADIQEYTSGILVKFLEKNDTYNCFLSYPTIESLSIEEFTTTKDYFKILSNLSDHIYMGNVGVHDKNVLQDVYSSLLKTPAENSIIAINKPDKIKIIKEINSLKYGSKKEFIESEVKYQLGM